MPHRNQELVALCYACKEPASAHCLRCAAPVCPSHEPPEDMRCASCESRHTEKTAWLRRAADGQLHSQIGRVTVGYLSALLASGFVWLPFALGLVGIGMFVAVLAFVTWWYRRTPPRKLAAKSMLEKKRKKFLAKRAPAPPLSLPSSSAH